MPNVAAQAHTRSPILNVNPSSGRNSEKTQPRLNHVGSPIVPENIMFEKAEYETRSQATGITPEKATTGVIPVTRGRVSSNTTTFQIPNARLSKRHSPNLIVDAAETC
ncbi:hypothetical protein ONS95_001866 [Cadophora gregata]|uniref:uncharacterized protein n=1 Tax=Cadophora gregata TaxID=51156 RepID=UPI0026DA9074|nr:uncharacterized protein ONS95_001866 [Cadophora gregata]KAK0111512.1 hypothetical protein ONS95_001866 [Cadophora gregata]KAK0112012.1 hypothetical protein ONS96_001274 [Cadophora gregata f. sp. sojae]